MPRSIIPSGQLVYGMQLPIQSQSTNYAQPWEAAAGAAELAQIVRATEEANFFYVAVCDHVAIPGDLAPAMSTTWYDTIATLSWIAGMTEKVRLLSHVYVPSYRHPLQAAKAWSTLDALSSGRAILGVGAGHVEGEFDLLKADFHARGRRTDEAVEAIKAAFESEFPSVEGENWTFEGFGQSPRPVQPGGPPIWIGGSSKAALRRVARIGDGWLPQGTTYAEMPEAVAYINEQREHVGRTEGSIDIGIITSFLYVGEPTFEVPPGSFTGDPERLARGLKKLGKLGANSLQVRFAARDAREMCDQILRFGAEVAPMLND